MEAIHRAIYQIKKVLLPGYPIPLISHSVMKVITHGINNITRYTATLKLAQLVNTMVSYNFKCTHKIFINIISKLIVSVVYQMLLCLCLDSRYPKNRENSYSHAILYPKREKNLDVYLHSVECSTCLPLPIRSTYTQYKWVSITEQLQKDADLSSSKLWVWVQSQHNFLLLHFVHHQLITARLVYLYTVRVAAWQLEWIVSSGIFNYNFTQMHQSSDS